MFKEIIRLKEMLEEAGIPFEFRELYDGYQIGYPVLPPDNKRVCDAVEHGYSYGYKWDLLEIMGLLTDEEAQKDSVAGYLTAEDVFARIQNHYKKEKEND